MEGIDGSNPLRELLRECVVRIDCDGSFSGSGFFVAPGEILTCAHVVEGAQEISVVTSDTTIPAEVAAGVSAGKGEGSHDLDVALLRFDHDGRSHPSVRLERDLPASGREPDVLYLSAFSRDVYAAGRAEPDGAVVTFEDRYGDLGVLKLKEGQVIRGFSGCPALNTRTGSVCGLVDRTRKETDDLGGFAIPIASVASAFPGLLERNADVHAADSRWEEAFRAEEAAAATRRGEAEVLPIIRPPYKLDPDEDYAPSELLKPRLGVVGLIGREELQANLMRWRESRKGLDVLLITGAGGMGKTRLGLEECARADDAGWTAGLLALDLEANPNEEIERLVGWPGRLFVAIDYAETRPSFVAALIARLARRRSGPPVRLILVCRQGGTREQLESLFAIGDDADSILKVLRQAEPVGLADPEHQLDSQRLFRGGVEAFAPYVGEGEPVTPPRVSLSNEHFARPLFVLAAALLQAEDPDLDIDALGRDELMLKLIDEHESRYWKKWNDSLGTGLDLELHPRTVAVAAMLGAETEDEALALVGVVPGLEDEPAERKRKIARWLSHLYGSGKLAEAPAIAAVEPDMVAEALVARECVDHEGLIGAALDAASDPQLTRALNVLTRASAGNELLAARASEALEQRLPVIVARAVDSAAGDSELAAAVELAIAALEPGSAAAEAAALAWKGGYFTLAAALFQLAIARRRQLGTESEQGRAELAEHLNEFGAVLDGLGRSEEAATQVEESAALFRELAEQNPERFVSNLAMALSNLAAVLDNNLGRNEEAIAPAEEAVAIYRELAEQSPERFVSSLANSLNNLSNVLDNLGRVEEALAAVEEAVELYRGLADENRHYLPSLAGSQSNLASILDSLGRVDEALQTAEEAVATYRELAEQSPERFVSSLAMALNNLSNRLYRIGKVEAAKPVIEEAVALYRMLAEGSPERYLQDLAMSLSNLALTLGDSGSSAEAVAAGREGVRLYRTLAERTPERYLADLASSLNNLASQLYHAGHADEARAAVEEAVAHRRRLVVRSPERYLPDLASSLNNLANVLDWLKHSEAALPVIEEAVGIYRTLAERTPERYLTDLAGSLSNMATVLDKLGRGEEAVGIGEEAVGTYRELAEQNPERFVPNLAAALNNVSNRLFGLERLDEALAAIEEAVAHRRPLAAKNPERFLPELPGSLDNLANLLYALDRAEEAATVAEEAVGTYRELAERTPERFVPDLAGSMNNLAVALDHLGRGDEPLAGLDQDIEDHKDSSVVSHLMLTKAKWHLRNEELEKTVSVAWDISMQERDAANRTAIAGARSLLRQLYSHDEVGFDAAWEDAGCGEKPAWLRYSQIDRPLVELVLEWFRTGQSDDSQAFLEAHEAELLSDEAEAAIEHLIDWRPTEPGFAIHLEMLRTARSDGVAAPYAKMAEELAARRRLELLQEWLSESDGERSLELLEANPTELLAPQSELDLLQGALQTPEDPGLYARAALLHLSRLDDPASAYALLGQPAEIDDEGFLRAGEEARALGLARLYSGINGERGEAQFQHALAAAAAGHAEEAEQAIDRCGRLLPSWERADYQRRLESLEAAHPRIAGSLAQLRGRLLASARA